MAGNSLIGIDIFCKEREIVPVIDVRSPSEFQKGHIVGAINIPLFSDNERAIVGIKYKKSGRIEAVKAGLDIVGPKMSQMVSDAIKIAPNKKLLLYCWRGGMRSASMAWLFNQVGIETKTLIGGYKTYRRTAQLLFSKSYKIFVLGGMTGSGKTAILYELEKMGQQVLDLEGIANHKGSAFGGIGQKPQPTTEQFENNLFEKLHSINSDKLLWLEDESISIGSVFIPQPLFDQMRKAIRVAINRPIDIRVKRLEQEYSQLPSNYLVDAVKRISKRLGSDNANYCIESIEKGNFSKAIEICLRYYDKTYNYGLSQHGSNLIHLELNENNNAESAEAILKEINNLTSVKQTSQS